MTRALSKRCRLDAAGAPSLPFHKGDGGEEEINAATKSGEYSKDVPHLTRTILPAELAALYRPQLKELCEALIVVDPSQRLGCKTKGGYDALRAHPYFKGLDWNALSVGPLKPPIKPQVRTSTQAHTHLSLALTLTASFHHHHYADRRHQRRPPQTDEGRVR